MHQFPRRQRADVNPPVIKSEPHFGHSSPHHSATSRCDWLNKAARHPRDEAFHHYPDQALQQPMQAVVQQHDSRHFQAAISPHYSLRTTVTPMPLTLPTSRYHLDGKDIKKERRPENVFLNSATQSTATPPNYSPRNSGFHDPPNNNYDYSRPINSAPQYTPYHQAYAPVYNSNESIRGIPHAMSLSYEQRNTAGYPPTMMQDPNQEPEDNMHHYQQNYPSPPVQVLGDTSYNPRTLDVDAAAALGIEDLPDLQHHHHQKEESDPPSPGRSKAIPKPDREITKGDDGRFVCTWTGCTEDTKSFNRKCEWSKHMDKHDRPYKCPADGCEKLPGFTYSGGLLRHQREVHNLHGGPRKQLNCPHPNCKRFSGKGFSRQENLNEHLRRVHTDGGETMMPNVGEETEEEGDARAGMKRKRTLTQQEDSSDIRQEMARLRAENEELKKQSQNMMQQIQQLQNMVGGGFQRQQHGPPHQAPQAPMM